MWILAVATALAGCADEVDEPFIVRRNPQTGVCEVFHTVEAVPAEWGLCSGVCSGLQEAECYANPSCHVAYKGAFWSCFELPPLARSPGTCSHQDATSCTTRNECLSFYNVIPHNGTHFDRCAARVDLLPNE